MLALGQRAVDAALAAGATYADVRLTHVVTEAYECQSVGARQESWRTPSDFATRGFDGATLAGDGIAKGPSWAYGMPTLSIGLGVRAFVQGYWGFASSASWSDADAVRLGREATGQAAVNARAGRPRSAELGRVPIVRQARWVQPGIDPFIVPIDEKRDWLESLAQLVVQRDRFANLTWVGLSLRAWREERAFVSSEGTSCSQLHYQCTLNPFEVTFLSDQERGESGSRASASLDVDPLGARGWEALRDVDRDTAVQSLLERARQVSLAPDPGDKPADIGKYDVVFGAVATGTLLHHTLGAATELDRAMGYEANAAGTSYLGPDPLQYLGTPVASPLISITADRTTPHALATTQWDDEGIQCEAFPLIRDGILIDYQTTREQAAWIAPWYEKRGLPVRSHGCAVAESALDCPIQMRPNLSMTPGASSADVDDLIKETARGVYFPSCRVDVDQQVKNGLCIEPTRGPREIRNGKLGPYLSGAAVMFSAQQFWTNVKAIGGTASARYVALSMDKGEPRQGSQCNVRAVPMKVAGCAIVNE
jgi:TldD protein